MKALVTGAAGFIGSALAERLLADGFEVVGIDSFEDFYPREQKEANLAGVARDERFRLVEENILEASDLRGVVADADVVFHLAAQAGVRSSWGDSFTVYTGNNVLATQMLLEAARDMGVRRFVYASSSSVYGDTDQLPMREDATLRPYSPYGVTKLAAEHLCHLYRRNFGVPTVSLRYFTVYGPRQRPDMALNRFMTSLRDGRPIEVYGDGTQTREFTYVDDVVDATIAVAVASGDDALGRPFNIGGGSRITVNDLVALVRDVTGRDPLIDHVPRQPGDVPDTWADVSAAREAFGYEPRVELAEGLRREWEWLAGA